MARKRISGLDELMIVNPGLPNRDRELWFGQVFIGQDGRLYELQGLQEEESLGELAEFYLGADGTLYSLERSGPFQRSHLADVEPARNLNSSYFLGEDGTLYQVIRS